MENQQESKPAQTEEKFITLVSEFKDFDEIDVRFEFKFKKPGSQQLSRANKEIQKNSERGFRNLLLTLVAPDQKDSFITAVEKHSGIATAFCNEIYERMGYASLGK